MSRIAKNPVLIPPEVEVKVENGALLVKGKLGQLKEQLDDSLVAVTIADNHIHFAVKNKSKAANALSGTLRSVAQSMVQGVATGFEKKLQLIGVGYRAQSQGQALNLSLGFSHPVVYQLPDGVSAKTPTPTEIIISGSDKQKVGQVAAEIRDYRPPEPYKGKGVRYADEHITIKETTKK